MTKDERLERLKRELGDISAEDRRLILTTFSRGYDEGFADGIVRGQNYQAQVTDMMIGVTSLP